MAEKHLSLKQLDEARRRVIQRVDELADVLIDASHAIHGHPELGYEEHFAHDLLTRLISEAGLDVKPVNKVLEGRPHIVDMIKNDEVDLIVNTTEGKQAIRDSFAIRRSALQHKVFYTTTITAAHAVCQAMAISGEPEVRRLQDLHAEMH